MFVYLLKKSYGIPIYYDDWNISYYLFVRGGLGIGCMYAYYASLIYLPIAEAIVLKNIVPVIIVFMA